MQENKHLVSDRIGRLMRNKNIPFNILFELTYKCNLKCVHCYVVNKRSKKELSTDEVKNILDQLAEAGCLNLVLSGGEILTRSDFFDIARHARQKKFCLTLFTNGTLIDKDTADRIARLYPLRVEISIYGSESSIHDSITRASGSFKRSIEALRLLRERKIRTKIKCSLMRQNISGYREVLKLAKDTGSEYSFDPTITPKSDGSKEPLDLRISNHDLYRIMKDPDLAKGAIDLDARGQFLEIKPDEFICKAGINFCDISAYGDVFPCVQFPLKAGSLRSKTFSQIWEDSQVFHRIRALTLNDLYQCRSCSLLRFCSRCPGLACLEDGDFLGPSRISCNTARIRNRLYRESQEERRLINHGQTSKERKTEEALPETADSLAGNL